MNSSHLRNICISRGVAQIIAVGKSRTQSINFIFTYYIFKWSRLRWGLSEKAVLSIFTKKFATRVYFYRIFSTLSTSISDGYRDNVSPFQNLPSHTWIVGSTINTPLTADCGSDTCGTDKTTFSVTFVTMYVFSNDTFSICILITDSVVKNRDSHQISYYIVV